MVLNRTVFQPKNRTIQSLQWGGRLHQRVFLVQRPPSTARCAYKPACPETFKLFGTNAGTAYSEFAFLL
jgi:hypothetical protein